MDGAGPRPAIPRTSPAFAQASRNARKRRVISWSAACRPESIPAFTGPPTDGESVRHAGDHRSACWFRRHTARRHGRSDRPQRSLAIRENQPGSPGKPSPGEPRASPLQVNSAPGQIVRSAGELGEGRLAALARTVDQNNRRIVQRFRKSGLDRTRMEDRFRHRLIEGIPIGQLKGSGSSDRKVERRLIEGTNTPRPGASPPPSRKSTDSIERIPTLRIASDQKRDGSDWTPITSSRFLRGRTVRSRQRQSALGGAG